MKRPTKLTKIVDEMNSENEKTPHEEQNHIATVRKLDPIISNKASEIGKLDSIS